jgi:NADH dehydrogenase [ubiquinone] 1 alpha subcomplex assembly factor 6
VIRDTGVEIGDLFELRPSAALNAAVERLAARAQDHLVRARALRPRVPRGALPAVLPAALAQMHLKALRTSGYDPFAPAVQRERPGRVWRLAWANLIGRY